MPAIPFDPQWADQILDGIATSKRGLAQVIADADLPISPALFYKWLIQNEELREKYTRAKEDQTQILEDEILQIADTPVLGEVITDKGDKVEIRRGDMIEHRKLQIESRKWLMGKLRPRKYGDKITQEHTGELGLQIISTVPRPGDQEEE